MIQRVSASINFALYIPFLPHCSPDPELDIRLTVLREGQMKAGVSKFMLRGKVPISFTKHTLDLTKTKPLKAAHGH